MATILRMPAVLANATEAVLANWIVEEGAAFTLGDTLAELETEKALVDLPAEQDGILGRRLAFAGDATTVGAPIAVLITVGETAADIDAALGALGRDAVEEPDAPAAADQTDAVQHSGAIEASAVEQPGASARRIAMDGGDSRRPDRLFASPIARRLAREGGLELSRIAGTGPGGRIVRGDVEAALRPCEQGVATAYTEIPHTRMRRAIARRLTESKSTVPHFYLTADCVVDELLDVRRRINAESSTKVSVNDLVVKAVAAAFAVVPEANVTWSDESLRLWNSVDIAVAVATDGGLLTPVVRGVEEMSLRVLSAEIADLVARARAGRLRQDELEGGSISISNLGMFGTTEFSAIINPPQSAILAVGAAKPQPVVVDGVLAVATVMRCTLSVDHRAIDGALAARWLAAFESKLAHPLSILI